MLIYFLYKDMGKKNIELRQKEYLKTMKYDIENE